VRLSVPLSLVLAGLLLQYLKKVYSSPAFAGSSLWAVVEQLRTLQHVFPQVDIKYDPDTLPTTPIIIHARPHFDLLFSGHQQRLHTICIRHLRDELHPPLVLRYKDTILTSETEVLRRVGVNRTFGPTYPGEELRYPGVWFAFDDDGRTESRPVKGAKKAVSGTTDERDQEVKKIVVGEKDFDPRERDVLDEVQECRAMDGDIKEALVKVSAGTLKVTILLTGHSPSHTMVLSSASFHLLLLPSTSSWDRHLPRI
jgi:hypothetical protein